MRLMYRWIVIAFALCAFISTGSQAANTPEAVATAFVQALDAQQYDQAVAFFAAKDIKEAEKAKKLEKIKKKMAKYALEMQENGGLERVEVLAPQKSEGSDTLVQIKIITKNAKAEQVPASDFYMRMEEGNWKIFKTGALNYKPQNPNQKIRRTP